MAPRLCVVTSRRRLGLSCSDLIRRIAWLASAGVDLVQIRERDLPDRELTALVRDAVAATRAAPAQVVVNDRFDIAMAADAAGVHLREDSVSIDRVRSIAPREFLIGCSVHDIDRARVVRVRLPALRNRVSVERQAGRTSDRRSGDVASRVCGCATPRARYWRRSRRERARRDARRRCGGRGDRIAAVGDERAAGAGHRRGVPCGLGRGES